MKYRRLPVFSNLVYVPRDQVDLAKVSKQLTVQVDFEAGDDDNEAMVSELQLFDLDKPGVIGLPRRYFKDTIGGGYFDRTVQPRYDPSAYPRRVTPRNEEQAAYMLALTAMWNSGRPTEVQANAATGSGKTATTIGSIAEAGIYPILIGVDKNSLKGQWLGSVERKEGFRFFMGEEWTAKNVGIVQQDRCDWRGKKVIIGMIPSLIRRRYERAFYDYIAGVAIDEVDVLAAPHASAMFSLFHPRILFGMTATEREGNRGKIIRVHLGKPAIISKQEVLKPTVYIVKIKKEQPLYGETMREFMTGLARLDWRNDILQKIIEDRGLARNRNIVILSDRVFHLTTMRDKLVANGMDPLCFGLFVGEYETGRYKVTADTIIEGVPRRMVNQPSFPSRAKAKRHAELWARERGATLVSVNISDETHTPTEEELDAIKGDPRYTVIGATYQKFGRGISIDRLDMGVELTPRGDVRQPLGRVLRTMDGKPIPEWYGLEEKLYYKETRQFGEGQPVEIKVDHADFKKLALARRKSYARQRADIVIINGNTTFNV